MDGAGAAFPGLDAPAPRLRREKFRKAALPKVRLFLRFPGRFPVGEIPSHHRSRKANGMRFLASLGLIGAGAFASGMFYSRASFDHRIDNWAILAALLAVAFAGVVDLLVVALRRSRAEA